MIHESCHGYANRADRYQPLRHTVRRRVAEQDVHRRRHLDGRTRGRAERAGSGDRRPTGHLRPSTLRDDVLVHHLLSHSSGIADYFEEDENLPDYDEEGMEKIWAAIPNYTVRNYAALLPFFRDRPPNFPPGEYHYSKPGSCSSA